MLTFFIWGWFYVTFGPFVQRLYSMDTMRFGAYTAIVETVGNVLAMAMYVYFGLFGSTSIPSRTTSVLLASSILLFVSFSSLSVLIDPDQIALVLMAGFIIKQAVTFCAFPFCKSPVIVSVDEVVLDRLHFAFSCLGVILFVASRIYALSAFHLFLDRVLWGMPIFFVLQIPRFLVPPFVADRAFEPRRHFVSVTGGGMRLQSRFLREPLPAVTALKPPDPEMNVPDMVPPRGPRREPLVAMTADPRLFAVVHSLVVLQSRFPVKRLRTEPALKTADLLVDVLNVTVEASSVGIADVLW